MKSISNSLNTHLAQEVTTLCTCWRLVRTDGRIFAFTSLDEDLTIGGVTYETQNGFMASAIASNSDFSVDNLDITGILDSDQITNEDLRNKLFDFATIYVFVTNYENPQVDDMRMRRGTLGEVTLLQNGSFTAEVRGMNQALSHNYIELFAPECRADFCDQRCKLSIANYTRKAVVTDVTSANVFKTAAFPDVTGGTSAGSHRYWRILMDVVPDSTHGGFADIKFWDQSLNEITGGNTYASSNDKHHEPKKARDGIPDSNWSTKTSDSDNTYLIEGGWWVIDFGSSKDVKEVEMISTKNYDESPTSWRLQWSDDFDHNNPQNATWHTAKVCGFAWTDGGQSAIWGIGSATSDPINYPDSPTNIPPPYTGASVYDGGTVTWRSGKNAGRTIEILSYDAGTGTITLFDQMAYDIAVGDSFEVAQGCDKRFETCKLYENVINFRGEPDVPGQDEFLTYPDAS